MPVAVGKTPTLPGAQVEEDPNLIRSDEFDGTGLDLTKWEYRPDRVLIDPGRSPGSVRSPGSKELA